MICLAHLRSAWTITPVSGTHHIYCTCGSQPSCRHAMNPMIHLSWWLMLTWSVSRRGNKPDETVIRIYVILLWNHFFPVSLKWFKVICCRQKISPNFCARQKYLLQHETISWYFVILPQFHHGYPPHHIMMCFLCRHSILLPHIMPFLGLSLYWEKRE